MDACWATKSNGLPPRQPAASCRSHGDEPRRRSVLVSVSRQIASASVSSTSCLRRRCRDSETATCPFRWQRKKHLSRDESHQREARSHSASFCRIPILPTHYPRKLRTTEGSACVSPNTKSPRKVLRSSPWARHFFNHLQQSTLHTLCDCSGNCSG